MQRSPACYGNQAFERIDCKQARIRRFLAVLKECGSARDLERGKIVHREAAESGDDRDLYLASSLIAMYSKCGDVPSARKVFDALHRRDVAVWTALVIGYVDNGLEEQALKEFSRMDCLPSPRAFVAALKACSRLAEKEKDDEEQVGDRTLERCRRIHSRASELGFDWSDLFVGNTVVDMYAKCGCMVDAQRAFDKIPVPDTVSWNALVLGYATNLQEEVALEVFSRFLSSRNGPRPNALSFAAVLKACSRMAMKEAASTLDNRLLVKALSLETGMVLHREAATRGLDVNLFVASSLVDLYAKCGSMTDAWRVYGRIESSNIVLWTALMLGYVENGDEDLALVIFTELRPINCQPNARSFLAAARACAGLAAKEEGRTMENERRPVKIKSLEKGMAAHSEALRCGCCDLFLASSLVSMYAKCRSMPDARRVFDGTERWNRVLWTALLSGYVDNGEDEKALELLKAMRREGYHPNAAVFVAGLAAACGDGAATAGAGKAFHAEICRGGIESDAQVGSKMVDLYSRAGMATKARLVFDVLPERNTVTWTSLLAGYCRAGKTGDALETFRGMIDEGFQADSVTFLCLLTACSHGGLVDKGLEIVQSMSVKYGVSPGAEHYACVADLLERARQAEVAEVWVMTSPVEERLQSGRLWRRR